MPTAHLSIGSNTGERILYLESALNSVVNLIGSITAVSYIYETQSWGYEGGNYLNMAIKVDTELAPENLLKTIHKIELDLGRCRVIGKYSDRTIDLDILFYNSITIHAAGLVVPHPHLHERMFVLKPLQDIDPEFLHPVLKKTINNLAKECQDKGWIERCVNMKLQYFSK